MVWYGTKAVKFLRVTLFVTPLVVVMRHSR
ncbi:hypothetical protein LINGRAHAP2_LOCUS5959 [Linum grandiflorum]